MKQPTLLAIDLCDVTKRFGERLVVQGLKLQVAPGEVLGFLGPNGAGKTTTIRLLTGFLRPTAGRVQLLGYDMADARAALTARRRLGYVPDVAGLDPGATGQWLLDALARLQGAAPVDREYLLDTLELAAGDLERPMGRLSRGTRQKINIVQGLQHRPELLVLDEPTEGLDPLTKRALFAILSAARTRGATIFFSSHILSEVEALCDRVALIRRGQLVAVDRIATLQRHQQRQVTLVLGGAAPPDVAHQLHALAGATAITQDDGRWRLQVAELGPLLALLATWPVRDVTIEPPSLEDLFLGYYQETPDNG